MHIPDGFLSPSLIATTQVLAVAGVAVALKQTGREMSPQRIPLLGMCAAFLFAIQLISFPVPGGTSVHISCVVLISMVLGPHSAILVSMAALFLQALLFQHGGLWSLGANAINIAFIPAFGGYYIQRLLNQFNSQMALAAAIILTKTIASATCSFMLDQAGMIPLSIGLPAMVFSGVLGGIAEAVVCCGMYNLIHTRRPALLCMVKI